MNGIRPQLHLSVRPMSHLHNFVARAM